MGPGIYIIEAVARCAGEARVLTCDGEPLWPIRWKEKHFARSISARRSDRGSAPYDYLVTSIPGEEAYFIVSTIGAETGKETPVRTEIREGATVLLELCRQDNRFIEFVNCIVWWDEVSEG